MGHAPVPVPGRFWPKVAKSGDGCWLWTAHRTALGYGRFNLRGKVTKAHRVSWELTNGPIPHGLCVLHKCDNPPCVRPDHLFLGTIADNQADMAQKGRSFLKQHPECALRGERSGMAKLTAAQARRMRERYASGETVSSLSRWAKVERFVVRNVVTGIAYSDADGPISALRGKAPTVKLDRGKAEEIRRRYDPAARNRASLAREYGVHPTTITFVVERRVWA